jgi:hypothetical protein
MKRFWVGLGAGAIAVLLTCGLDGVVLAAAASSAGDRRIAEEGVLTEADFPRGWTSSPRDSSNDSQTEKTAKTIPACKGYLALRAAAKKQPNATSPEFELGDSEIDNTVSVFPTTRSATKATKAFDAPAVPSCINSLFTKVFTEALADDPATSGQIDDIDVDIERAPVAEVADSTTAYEGTVRISARDGSSQTIGVGVAAVRVGRGVTLFSYVVDASGVVELLPSLVDASVARLTVALA